jgi:hypothetical protein
MDSMSDSISDAKNDAPESDGKLKRKHYKREIARRHVEFVKLEQWVVHKGLNAARLSAALGLPGPMAYAIIGGLVVATLLTLLFLPALSVAWFRIKELRKEPEPRLGAGVPAAAK